MKKVTGGFTIVELLIVVVVIAILASISVVAYSRVQSRARDSLRMNQTRSMAIALELYRADNGQYPWIDDGIGTETGCGSQTENWGHCDRLKALTDALAPYGRIDPTTLSSATQGNYYYEYNSNPTVDTGDWYGLMVYLEGNGGNSDGGYFSNAFEVGNNPRYCRDKYAGTSGRWTWSWNGTNTVRCYGGN